MKFIILLMILTKQLKTFIKHPSYIDEINLLFTILFLYYEPDTVFSAFAADDSLQG